MLQFSVYHPDLRHLDHSHQDHQDRGTKDGQDGVFHDVQEIGNHDEEKQEDDQGNLIFTLFHILSRFSSFCLLYKHWTI